MNHKIFLIVMSLLFIGCIIGLCNHNKQELIPISVHHVDDSIGIAYGIVRESDGADTKVFEVTTNYSALVYDSTNNVYFLNMDKYAEGNTDTLCKFVLVKHELATAPIEH